MISSDLEDFDCHSSCLIETSPGISMLNSTPIHAEDLARRTINEPKSTKRFSNQVVIVTGASRGIGRGIAHLFAEEGAKVVLVGRDEAQLKSVKDSIQANDGNAIFVQADVSSPKDMERMVDEALNELQDAAESVTNSDDWTKFYSEYLEDIKIVLAFGEAMVAARNMSIHRF